MSERDDRFDMTGRVVLVTGASSHGIGHEAARLLAQRGARVFLTARREEKLQAAAAEIEADGGIAAYAVCDVSREEDCKAAVEKCVEVYGQLDVCVLAAGSSGLSASGGYEAIFDTENWNRMLQTNLGGVFWMIKYAAPECAKSGHGSIIPVASLSSWHCAGSAAYTATKGAIRSLTQYFGKKFQELGMPVRVNTIYPGFIDTDMTHRALEQPAYADTILKNIPMGRAGTVKDIAYGILYLASDASSFMTGQHLIVDGGELA